MNKNIHVLFINTFSAELTSFMIIFDCHMFFYEFYVFFDAHVLLIL